MKNWRQLLTDNIYHILFGLIVLIFFYPFILFGKIPIPADTIVGMYHPFRDVVWDSYTAGVPFKNFLITDPVRQQYVWRKLAIEELKKGNLPLWNPYSFSGTPLLANFQTAAFYPLNILFFILPFNLSWGILVVLQPLLAGLFLYAYLRFLRISKLGSFLGSVTFSFSGFTIAWLEWNTVIHTILWLPLMLLSIEEIMYYYSSSERSESRSLIGDSSRQARTIKIFLWSLIFIFSLVSSFLAGHLQIFFYSFLVVGVYTIGKIILSHKDRFKVFLLFVICFLLFVIITSIQWFPTLQFILNSAREFDQGSFMKEGWFLPWQSLIQFVAPDFFGNPATGNYWGVWNYGEFIGYIGIIPLILALFALIMRQDRKTWFFSSVVIASLLFALPTPLAKLPYQLQIPFVSTSQPTRLLGLVDFSLAILAALGLDYFLKNKSSMVQIIKLLGIVGFIYGIIWFLVLNSSQFLPYMIDRADFLIAGRNLILPTILFILGSGSLTAFIIVKNNNLKLFFVLCSLFFVAVDLLRFGWKFTPFTKENWIFPDTKLIKQIRENKNYSRIMVTDRRIMPPNFSGAYRLQDVSGYDPLYLKIYGQLAASWERGSPDISPASFNRILTPSKIENFITDLLGVKYILSLNPIQSGKLELLDSEGQTNLYINKNVFPRAFFVEEVIKVNNSQEEINMMFKLSWELRNKAVSQDNIKISNNKLEKNEEVNIIEYSPAKIILQARTNFERLLILADIYYPAWEASIDGQKTKIYPVDFALRGVIVPKGDHIVEFKIKLI